MTATDEPQRKSGPVRWLRRSLRNLRQLVLHVLNLIGRYEFTVLVAMLVILLAILAFVAIAEYVSDGASQRFDEGILRAFRRSDDPVSPLGQCGFWRWAVTLLRLAALRC